MFKNTKNRLPEWIKEKKKQDSIIRCLQVIHFKYDDIDILKVKKCRKIYYNNTNHKKFQTKPTSKQRQLSGIKRGTI